jgi:hypothetical protein
MKITIGDCNCKICGKSTSYMKTLLCLTCWELNRRMRRDFDIAEKIYKKIKLERDLKAKHERKN